MGSNQYICVLMTGKNKKAKKSVYKTMKVKKNGKTVTVRKKKATKYGKTPTF